jgi:hypothetical protein
MNKRYKLFLDDIRDVNMVYQKLTNDHFVVVRNFHDFKNVILENGLPEFISFDNDLGLDEHDNIAEDGYAAAKWLVYESGLDLENLIFNVHSANPVAAQQIQSLLDNYIKHLKKKRTTNKISKMLCC